MLNEALDPYWPLLERLKFLAIFHSNLDEFFMIRVSGLHEQLEAAVVENSPDGLNPREQLSRIAQITRRQVEVAAKLFSSELVPALAKQRHPHPRLEVAVRARPRSTACQYFRRSVFPVLTPLAVDPGPPVPVPLQPVAVAGGRGPRSRHRASASSPG